MKCPGLLYSLSIFIIYFPNQASISIHQPKSPIHHFCPRFFFFFLWLFGLFGSPCSPRRRPSWHRRPTRRAPAASPRRPGAAAGAGAPSGRAAPPPGCDGRAPGAACRRTWGTPPGGTPCHGDFSLGVGKFLGIMENVGNGKIEGIWSILLNVWFYCICFHFKPSLMSLMLENGRKIIWLKGKKLEIYNQERAAKPGNSSLGSTIESLFAPTVLEHTWTTCYICADWPYRTDFKHSADLSLPHWTHGRKIQWLHLKMCPFEQGHNLQSED